MTGSWTVNGREIAASFGANETLLDVLRRAGHTEVKRGCSRGECGSCLVLLDDELVNSCQVFAATVVGRRITTSAGLAARSAVGDHVHLMLDCNNGWRNLETALRYMAVFEPYAPYWIEEPFLPDDLESHVRLAERTPVPVATGEIESGRWRFKEILERRAAGILPPDAVCCGGITEFRRIAATAASFGVSVCPPAYHELHVHLAASLPNVPYAECFTDDQIVNFRRLIDTQVEIRDGRLVLPSKPGCGFDFLPDVVAALAVEPWG